MISHYGANEMKKVRGNKLNIAAGAVLNAVEDIDTNICFICGKEAITTPIKSMKKKRKSQSIELAVKVVVIGNIFQSVWKVSCLMIGLYGQNSNLFCIF